MKTNQITKSKENCDPGIYCFRNKINGKCYIGQAINLKNRYNDHMRKYHNHGHCQYLYRAFNKYGIDNFEYFIVERVEFCDNIKEVLDDLEKKYIQEYDSYNNGYNLTLGGDAGVLGLKMTDEQKEKISRNSQRIANDGRFQAYIYDYETKEILTFTSFSEAGRQLNLNAASMRGSMKYHRFYLNRWFPSRNKEEIEELISSGKMEEYKKKSENYLINNKEVVVKIDNYGKEQYLTQDQLDFYEEYYHALCEYYQNEDHPTAENFAKALNLSRISIIKRNEILIKLGYKLPSSHRKIDKIILHDTISNEDTAYTLNELCKLFKNTKDSMRTTVRHCQCEDSLYLKRYVFKVIYKK